MGSREEEIAVTAVCASMDDLPDTVLDEILQRLPCKSAFRCKCVSKRWLALISDPYFVLRFLNHRFLKKPKPTQFTLIFDYYDTQELSRRPLITWPKPVVTSPKFLLEFFEKMGVHAIGSSNDLVLFCANFKIRNYYICNPLTMQWVSLPLPPPDQSVATLYVIYKARTWFICEPYYSCSKHGELVLNANYRFKVVLIPEFEDRSSTLKVLIFSSETVKWSESVVSLPQPCRFRELPDRTFVYNGILHWFHRNGIIAYDPLNVSSKCRFIVGPADLRPYANHISGLCRGHVRIAQLRFVFQDHDYDSELWLSIWELKDYDRGRWCLEHQASMRQMLSEDRALRELIMNTGDALKVEFLAFHPDDGDVVYLRFDDRVVSCNIQTRMLTVVCKIPQTVYYQYRLGSAFLLVRPWWPTPMPMPFLTQRTWR